MVLFNGLGVETEEGNQLLGTVNCGSHYQSHSGTGIGWNPLQGVGANVVLLLEIALMRWIISSLGIYFWDFSV